MEPDDRKLIASIAIVLIGYAHCHYSLMYDSMTAGSMVLLEGVQSILAIFMVLGFIGVLWYGFVKGAVLRVLGRFRDRDGGE